MARLAVLASALVCITGSLAGQSTGTALVRRAPNLNGGTVDGSVQMMSAEDVALTATATVTRDLLVPGMPDVRINGNPTYSGTLDGSGSALPAGYQITVGGGATLRNVVRRTNPVAIASVGAPRPTSGTHSVVRKSSSEPRPDFSTLRDLTLTNGAGQIAVPPGAYGDFTAHDKSGFTIGISGATEPAHYDFQHLDLSAGSELVVVGPVVVTVGYAVSTHGVMGSSAQPAWLTLNIFSGGLTLAGAASVDGYVNAPTGTVALSGNARLTGGVSGDSITMLGDAIMRLQAPAVPTPNVPPTVALLAPAEGTLFTAPASMLLSASASDPDGTITKVEFFQGGTKLGQALDSPFDFVWNNAPPGAYVLTARAYDNEGASTVSAARNVTVQIGLPYFTGFEAPDGYILGAFSGQLGWSVTGSAALIESAGLLGSRALLVGGAGTASAAVHGFPNATTQPIAFVDFFTKPAAGPSASSSVVLQADAAQIAFVRAGDTGQFVVLNGDGSGGGTWVPVGSIVPLGSDGRALGWLQLTVREDFGTKRWDLYIDGRLVSCELGFADNAAQSLSQITLGGPAVTGSLFDDLFAGFDNPLFVDGDRDGMPDAWETSNGLNLLINDRNGDLDADGVTNIIEYQFGTLPTLADTDGDGLPDAWEIQYRLAPTRASATDDSDADGLTDLQEYNGGTNPSAADTDGDGMPDGWEVAYGLDPKQPADAAADPDGDGKTNLVEYQGGTNPNEYYNGALPVLVSLVGPNLRTGANGLVGVRVTQADGTLLTNAPISFEATSGGISLSTSPLGTNPSVTVAVRSDAQGIASIYVQYPNPAAPLSTLVATAWVGTQAKTLSITIAPPIIDTDADGLHDPWEERYLGSLGYTAGEDPGGIGRTLAQSHFLDSSPWPGPAVSNGLQLWYRADLGISKDGADRVSRWADLSGNAVHLAQTTIAAQPVALAASLGGKAAVRFDGVASTMRTSIPVDLAKGSSDMTVIVVVKAGATQREYADIIDYNHGTPTYGGFAVQQNMNMLNQYGFAWRAPDNQNWVGLTPTVPVPAGSPQLLEFVKGGTAQTGYLNGAVSFVVTVPAQMAINAPRIFSLGSFVAENSRYFTGEIAEVLIYNRALTAAERAEIEGACGRRYFDTDNDGLSDLWETTMLGTLSYGAQDDPGGVNRSLLQSQQQGLVPWPAAPIGAGLQVWYRADLGVATDASSRVTRWTDLSGNGVHAMQSDPSTQPLSVAAAAGSMPAVRFNGSTTVLRSARADLLKGGTDITVITVVKPAASQVAYADILDYDHGTAPYGGFVLQQNWTSVNEYGLVWMNPSGTAWEGMTPTVTVPAGAVQVLSIVKSGTTQSAFLNSEPRFTTGISAQVQVNPPRVLAVGNFGAGGGRPFNGDLAEVLIFNRALSAAERTQVETALAQKYAGAN